MIRQLFTWGAVLALVAGCASLSDSARDPAQPAVVSLKLEYARYMAESANLSINKRAHLFQSVVANREPEVFRVFVYRKRLKPPGERTQLRKYLPNLTADRQPKVMRAFDNLERTLTQKIAQFKKAFPGADYRYRIYIVPSFDTFSGRADFLTTGPAVVFGADKISKFNEDLDVLVTHEMFHALHFQTLGLTKEWMQRNADLVTEMWFEGLASYMSVAMAQANPSEAAAFGVEAATRCRQRLPHLRDRYLSDISHTTFLDEVLETRWLGGGEPKSGIPPMAAYCLGFNVAKKLAAKLSLRELIALNPVTSKDVILRTLREL